MYTGTCADDPTNAVNDAAYWKTIYFFAGRLL